MKKLHGSELKSAVRLTARQEQAIQALLTGANVNEVARNLQVGRTTLYRWLNDAAFRTAYQAAQERSHTWTVNRLQSLTAKAIQVLERILDDAEAPAVAKVEAARAVLDFALLGKEPSNQRGALGPGKSDLSLSAPHVESILHEGRVTVLEQVPDKQPAQPLHGA
ncbi:MAG TPA: phBC6A51 family helix-turn-helix protein [Candidatus Binatia bacterium]|jgi:transposase-like protein|nr:phBC6A51 family helix-turn-helix protein [Candidatus Binatia bacterium]